MVVLPVAVGSAGRHPQSEAGRQCHVVDAVH